MFAFDAQSMVALAQVVLIDIVLAGDNAIIVGMAAAGVTAHNRARVIAIGVAAAAIIRIAFALVTTELLSIRGLTFIGGFLLSIIAVRLWRENHKGHRGQVHKMKSDAPKTTMAAIIQIIIADISMSLDNVLAVAGAARDHSIILVVGLALSVTLMGLAASFIARLIDRHHWIAYVGIAMIAYISIEMMIEGWPDFAIAAEALISDGGGGIS